MKLLNAPNPMMIFNIFVADMVRTHLLDYYARELKTQGWKDKRHKVVVHGDWWRPGLAEESF